MVLVRFPLLTFTTALPAVIYVDSLFCGYQHTACWRLICWTPDVPGPRFVDCRYGFVTEWAVYVATLFGRALLRVPAVWLDVPFPVRPGSRRADYVGLLTLPVRCVLQFHNPEHSSAACYRWVHCKFVRLNSGRRTQVRYHHLTAHHSHSPRPVPNARGASYAVAMPNHAPPTPVASPGGSPTPPPARVTTLVVGSSAHSRKTTHALYGWPGWRLATGHTAFVVYTPPHI